MAFNKETNERMEQAAKEAFNTLKVDMSHLNSEARAGADLVVEYFKRNYMTAGYKKLARKLVKDDPEG